MCPHLLRSAAALADAMPEKLLHPKCPIQWRDIRDQMPRHVRSMRGDFRSGDLRYAEAKLSVRQSRCHCVNNQHQKSETETHGTVAKAARDALPARPLVAHAIFIEPARSHEIGRASCRERE